MKKLPGKIKRKKEIWKKYKDNLKDLDEITWIKTDISSATPLFIDIYDSDPGTLSTLLKDNGIGSRPVYPPIHSQQAYNLGNLSFPVTEFYARRGLWLPSSSKLTDQQIDTVCNVVRSCFN